MKKVIAILVPVLLAGCTMVTPQFLVSDDTKTYRAAQASFDQGKYKEAHDAFRAIAAGRSSWAEQSKFDAAYVLVYYKNPEKNFAAAEQEFNEFLARYPGSAHAEEAHTWLALLRMFDQTKAGELVKEVASLRIKIEGVAKELQKTQTDNEALMRERDSLLTEKNGLAKKVNALLSEKDALIAKNTALLKSNEKLGRENAALEKKIGALEKDKRNLMQAKTKLEKSLRALTMIDVKMEKRRKKIQNREEKK
jgi:outer membrane protein assembly factor BamD (BamD/ComL family)